MSKYAHELFQSLELQRIHDQSLMLQKNSELVAFVDSVWQELMSSEVAHNLHCLFHLLDRRVYKRFWRESGEVLERVWRGSGEVPERFWRGSGEAVAGEEELWRGFWKGSEVARLWRGYGEVLDSF